MSPTALSLKLLRREGYAVAIVERWLPHANLRSDCYGFADLLACRPRDKRIVLVQTTSLNNLSSRLKKAKSKLALETWLGSGGLFEVHGWVRKPGRGWEVKHVEVKAGEVDPVILEKPRRRRKNRFQQLELFQ